MAFRTRSVKFNIKHVVIFRVSLDNDLVKILLIKYVFIMKIVDSYVTVITIACLAKSDRSSWERSWMHALVN